MTFKYDDKQKFSAKVEEFVRNNGGGYIEAVLEVCETENMEPEVGAKLLTQPILEKIQSTIEEEISIFYQLRLN